MCMQSTKSFRANVSPLGASHILTENPTTTHGSSSRTAWSTAVVAVPSLASALTAMIAGCVGFSSLFCTSTTTDDDSGYPASPRLLTYALVFLWILHHFAKYCCMGNVVDCVNQVDDVVTRVSSSQTMTRIRSSSIRLMEMMATSGRVSSQHGLLIGSNECSDKKRVPVITASHQVFIPLDAIASLSLTDIKDLMRYAIDRNRLDFSKRNFLLALAPAAREAAVAMDMVVLSSRGQKFALSTRSVRQQSSILRNDDAGDTDALTFVAFTRVFSEWRSLRLVPEGYKRYAAAMALAKRDLNQNIQKIETAVHNWMAYHEHSKTVAVELATGRQLSSPTLKQLLVWEKKQNIHNRLPRLVDKSGASGLLWAQRQLQYQTSIFENILQIPTTFESSKDAVASAYKSTYDAYHGFLVRSVFESSFDASPDASVILKHMKNSHNEEAPISEGKYDSVSVSTTVPDDYCSGSSSEDHFMDCTKIPKSVTIDTSSKRSVNGIQEFGQQLAYEWMKLERFLNQCKGAESTPRDVFIISAETTALSQPSNLRSSPKMVKMTSFVNVQTAASDEISSYLTVMQPVLLGLDEMIENLHMKDPTRC